MGRRRTRLPVSGNTGGRFFDHGRTRGTMLHEGCGTMAPSAQDLLDKLNTAIETRIDGGLVQSYVINGRNLARDPLKDLIELRDRLKQEVNSTAGARNFVEFTDPQ